MVHHQPAALTFNEYVGRPDGEIAGTSVNYAGDVLHTRDPGTALVDGHLGVGDDEVHQGGVEEDGFPTPLYIVPSSNELPARVYT